MARLLPSPMRLMSRSKPSSSSITLRLAFLRNVSRVGIGMSSSTFTLGNSGESFSLTSRSNAPISAARFSLSGESRSQNLFRSVLISLPKRRSSGLKISCKSLVKAWFPSKSQMAIDSGNMRWYAFLNSSLGRTHSRLSPLRWLLGTKTSTSIPSGFSPGMRCTFLTRSRPGPCGVFCKYGRTAAARSSPRRPSTCSEIPSKTPTTSTGRFGSSKYEMSNEKLDNSQRMPIKMFVLPALL